MWATWIRGYQSIYFAYIPCPSPFKITRRISLSANKLGLTLWEVYKKLHNEKAYFGLDGNPPISSQLLFLFL